MTILSVSPVSAAAQPFARGRAWIKPLLGAILALAMSLGIGVGLTDLLWPARLVLITFGLAVIGWIFTEINDTYIAVVAALVLSLSVQGDPASFFATLGDPLIWLLLASFIIAAGVTASGLSVRLTAAVAGRTRSVNHLFYGLTFVILATAFVIPATSGRAALLMPIFLSLSQAINQPSISRALALLFPTTILLSAVASLLGAGAHLVTADLLVQLTGETITFARWTLLGLPFALVSCLLSTWVILRIFLTHAERTQPLHLAPADITANHQARLSRREQYMALTIALLVLLWATESLHGVNNTVVALFGALAVTLPHVELVPFKNALKHVEWNLLLFMAATLKISEALVTSGAADWLIHHAFQSLATGTPTANLLLVTVVAAVSLLAHLLITSRTARASVLVPMVVLLGLSLDFNPVLLAFLSTAAAGFCLTLPVSAKPVAMFANLEVPAYTPRDLLRLSGVLLPLHLVLLVVFALWIWPALGLTPTRALAAQPAIEQPTLSGAHNVTPAAVSSQLLRRPVHKATGASAAILPPVMVAGQHPILLAGDGTFAYRAFAPNAPTTGQSAAAPPPAAVLSAITTTLIATPTQPLPQPVVPTPVPAVVEPMLVEALPAPAPVVEPLPAPPAAPVIVPPPLVVEAPPVPAPVVEQPPAAEPPVQAPVVEAPPAAPPAAPVIVPPPPVAEAPLVPAPVVEQPPAAEPPIQAPVVEAPPVAPPPASPINQSDAANHQAAHDDNDDDGDDNDDDNNDDDNNDD